MRRYFAGIDVGSWNTKALIIDEQFDILGKMVVRSGADLEGAAKKAYEGALKAARVDKKMVQTIVATGFGRRIIKLAQVTRTEITCHGLGANHFYPSSLTVVDIGGQDTKVITVDASGRNIHFVLNRKCAAGTGAFLEEMALRLDLKLDKMNDLAMRATKRLKLGSFCTVFTGTEILRLVQEGEKVEDLARAIYASIVQRVAEMQHFEGQVVLTGGVIEYNPVLKDIFEEETSVRCLVPPDPQYIGALGAARLALGLKKDKRIKKKK